MKKLLAIPIIIVGIMGLFQISTTQVSSQTAAIPHSDNFNDSSLDTTYWTKIESDAGVTVEETGMEIKVSGTSNNSTWGKNGLKTPTFSKQSFQTSIGFKLVNMTDNHNMLT